MDYQSIRAHRQFVWVLFLLYMMKEAMAEERHVCLGAPVGRLLNYPGRCDLFIECSRKRSIVRQCGPRLYFNPAKGICDYSHHANCLQPPYGPLGSHSGDYHNTNDEGKPNYDPPPPRHGAIDLGYDIDRSLDTVRAYCDIVMKEAKIETHNRLRREFLSSELFKGSSFKSPFRYVANFLSSRPYSKTLSKSGMSQMEALRLIKYRFRFTTDQMMNTLGKLNAHSLLKEMPGRQIPDTTMPDPLDVDYCPYPINYDCSEFLTHRSIEGSCNNLHRPILGRSMTPFRRLVPARYDDGLEVPRRSVTGDILPGARFVSASLFHDLNLPSRETTMIFVFFGQFVDHDLTRTALTMIPDPEQGPGKTKELTCGMDGCQVGPGLENCMPIPVPEDDPDFRYNRCLMFVRDMEVPHLNCEIGHREQLDQVTHWLDGSMIYGSTKEESDLLRDLTDSRHGKMGVVAHPHGSDHFKPLLPREIDPNSMCHHINDTHFCFRAGDPRVNENAGLGIIHIVWVRHHNQMESVLRKLNPHWDGERLFEETRRIIVAFVQHITFNEWLPLLLGPDIVRKFGLVLEKDGYFKGYDPSVDSRLPNAFAAAAFRIGHTLLNERLNRINDYNRLDDRLFLSETFNRPQFFYDTGAGGVDALIRGLAGEPSQTFDTFFTKQITRSLFSERPPFGPGHDLLSLNIQRGRDHGIGTYNDYREFCGLKRAKTFEDLSGEIRNPISRERLKRVYRDVEDIDLFAGGVYEDSVEGGIAGPTLACIIANTFRNIRLGDRFWYENEQAGFTHAQLREIRKISAARILCLNSDRVHWIQPFAFLQPGARPAFSRSHAGDKPYNVPVPCHELPDIDLNYWKHGPYTY